MLKQLSNCIRILQGICMYTACTCMCSIYISMYEAWLLYAHKSCSSSDCLDLPPCVQCALIDRALFSPRLITCGKPSGHLSHAHQTLQWLFGLMRTLPRCLFNFSCHCPCSSSASRLVSVPTPICCWSCCDILSALPPILYACPADQQVCLNLVSTEKQTLTQKA